MTRHPASWRCAGLSSILPKEIDHFLSGLSDFDEIPIGVSHVTSRLPTVIVERLREELCPFGLPVLVASLCIGHP
jgi:hypothetical protein